MWIDRKLFNPSKKGYYKCLVEWDDMGSFKETNKELFNGQEWDIYESCQQHIRFWWANEEEYKIISEKWDKQALEAL